MMFEELNEGRELPPIAPKWLQTTALIIIAFELSIALFTIAGAY